MHTQGKWTTREIEENYINIVIDDNSGRLIGQICKVFDNSEANAKRIVQMHNSYDGLLEACKSMLKNLKKEELTQYVDFHVRKQMREAIAQAEEPDNNPEAEAAIDVLNMINKAQSKKKG